MNRPDDGSTAYGHAGKRAADCYLFLAFTLALIVALSGDNLLFRSDWLSLFKLFGLLNLACIGLAALCGQARRLSGLARGGALLHLTAGSFLLCLDTLAGPIEPSWMLLCLAAAAYPLAHIKLARSSMREELLSRMDGLARGAAACGSLYTLAFLIVTGTGGPPRARAAAPRGVIYIVMDGLGPSYLRPYAQSGLPAFEELGQAGRIFTNTRTNRNFTYGYFLTLYSGRKDGGNNMYGQKRRRNVLQELQERGVRVRISSAQNNSMPDSMELPYRGLRSAFLTSRYEWLPRLIGLEYAAFRYRGSRGRTPERVESLLPIANAGVKRDRQIDHYLLDQVASLKSGGDPYFLMFHTFYDGEASAFAKDAQLFEIEKAGTAAGGADATIDRKVIADEYVYDPANPAERAWMEKAKRKYIDGMEAGLASLRSFFERAEAGGLLENTLVIVTSDHGKVFGHGRVWYGYHNDEEVSRVPLLIRGDGLSGIDGRLLETIDLSRTILSAHGIETAGDQKSCSLLDPACEKEYVTSLTLPSNKRKTQFLNIYRGGSMSVYDVYPAEPKRLGDYTIESFAPTPATAGTQAPSDLISEALGAYLPEGCPYDRVTCLSPWYRSK